MRWSYLMEIVLRDATVFNVKNAFQSLHIQEVHLLQILQLQRDAAQLFPDQRSQVKVQGLLGTDGHAHQYAQKLELKHVVVQTGGRVEKKPVQARRNSMRCIYRDFAVLASGFHTLHLSLL